MSEIFSKTAPKWATEHSENDGGISYYLNLRIPAVCRDYGSSAHIQMTVSWVVREDGTLALQSDLPEIYIAQYTADAEEKAKAMASLWSYAAALLGAIKREEWDEFARMIEPADEPPAQDQSVGADEMIDWTQRARQRDAAAMKVRVDQLRADRESA